MKHKHRPCPCGCGELADECMRPGSGLNAFSIEERAERRPMSDRTGVDDLSESEAQIRAESQAEERADAIEREDRARRGWRPVTEWDSPDMPPCTHDPDEPGAEEFFPDPDAEPPF